MKMGCRDREFVKKFIMCTSTDTDRESYYLKFYVSLLLRCLFTCDC